MKQFLLLPGAALLLMTAALPATAETVNISTPNTSLVLDAEKEASSASSTMATGSAMPT